MGVKITSPHEEGFEQLMAHVIDQLSDCYGYHTLALKHIDDQSVILKCKTCGREYGFSRRIYDEMFTWKDQAQFKKSK